MAPETVHILVSGLVQGVGYRWFAARTAEKLGLTGYVRNLDDGTVEVVVAGSRALIEGMVSALRVGPRGARVASIRVDRIEVTETYDGFEIR